jgi:hypothetical protein
MLAQLATTPRQRRSIGEVRYQSEERPAHESPASSTNGLSPPYDCGAIPVAAILIRSMGRAAMEPEIRYYRRRATEEAEAAERAQSGQARKLLSTSRQRYRRRAESLSWCERAT